MTVNPTTQRTSSAERSRRYRKRQQLRHIVLPVTIDEFALADALVAAGRLTQEEAVDRNLVAEALEREIEVWIAGGTRSFDVVVRSDRLDGTTETIGAIMLDTKISAIAPAFAASDS